MSTITQNTDFFEARDQMSKLFLTLLYRTVSGIHFKTKSQKANKKIHLIQMAKSSVPYYQMWQMLKFK